MRDREFTLMCEVPAYDVAHASVQARSRRAELGLITCTIHHRQEARDFYLLFQGVETIAGDSGDRDPCPHAP